jgi:hypothetical protein
MADFSYSPARGFASYEANQAYLTCFQSALFDSLLARMLELIKHSAISD